eukprot:TRINITY_DN2135_c0_g1_i1.p1 TRINITY_DN2135_c0_g1~~TRINITY_DN2135_c0_g1_i1.p1  ORF type:complete len:328 (+),score=69.65 TRINITY_DN2135_c0_g1_i1:454-1437(+)
MLESFLSFLYMICFYCLIVLFALRPVSERPFAQELINNCENISVLSLISLNARSSYLNSWQVNNLVKRVTALKREKEELLVEVEQEEEYLTNTLQRRLDTIRDEKIELEKRLEAEQEFIVNRLQKQLAVVIDEKIRLQKKLSQETQERLDRSGTSASESESEKEEARDRSLSGQLSGIGDNFEKQNVIFEHLRRTIDTLRRELRKSRRELDIQKECLQKANDDKVMLAIKLRRFLHQHDSDPIAQKHHHPQDAALDQDIEQILSSIGTRSRPNSFSRTTPIPIRGAESPETKLRSSSGSRLGESLGSNSTHSLDHTFTSPVGSPSVH